MRKKDKRNRQATLDKNLIDVGDGDILENNE